MVVPKVRAGEDSECRLRPRMLPPIEMSADTGTHNEHTLEHVTSETVGDSWVIARMGTSPDLHKS